MLQNQVFAQNIDMLSDVDQAIADQELNECSQDDNRSTKCNEIPGHILSTSFGDQLDPKKTDSQCSETDETKKKKKKKKKKSDDETTREVVLVAELHTFDKRTMTFVDSKPAKMYNPKLTASIESKYFLDIILNLPERLTDQSDDNIAKEAAKLIADYTSTEQEKLNFLGELTKRLYDNYNDKRNPTQNKKKEDIPSGAISLANMFSAAAAKNPDQGGVCNDISISIAQIAEKLFPEKDVLVVNNGTHYGVMLHDKNRKNKMVASVGTLIDDISDPLMDSKFAVPNARILKLENNKLKQIAVVDTEVGVALKKVIQGQTDALSMGIDPSLVMASYKTQIEKRDKRKTYELKTAVAQTSNAEVLIVVAQSSKETKHNLTTTALSVMQQNIKNSPQSNIIVGFHTGIQKTVIQYQNPRLIIKASAGAEADLSYGFQSKTDQASPLWDIMPITATLKTNQAVDFKTMPRNPMNPSASGRFQVVQDYGPTDEGARQGTMPDPNGFKAAWKSMKYMGFTLNQAKADVNINVPINQNIKSFSQLQYQGSNISQNFKVLSGFEIISDGGETLMAYIGYMGSEKGYKLRSSLSTRPDGTIIGGGIKTKKGLEVNANAQIGNGLTGVQTNIGIKKNFGLPKKKQK